MSDRSEAAKYIQAIRDNMVEDGKVIIETSEGEIKYEQVTNNFGSIFPVDGRYWSAKTQKLNEINGAGVFQVDTDDELIHKLVLVIRRMRIANRNRREIAAAKAERAAATA